MGTQGLMLARKIKEMLQTLTYDEVVEQFRKVKFFTTNTSNLDLVNHYQFLTLSKLEKAKYDTKINFWSPQTVDLCNQWDDYDKYDPELSEVLEKKYCCEGGAFAPASECFLDLDRKMLCLSIIQCDCEGEWPGNKTILEVPFEIDKIDLVIKLLRDGIEENIFLSIDAFGMVENNVFKVIGKAYRCGEREEMMIPSLRLMLNDWNKLNVSVKSEFNKRMKLIKCDISSLCYDNILDVLEFYPFFVGNMFDDYEQFYGYFKGDPARNRVRFLFPSVIVLTRFAYLPLQRIKYFRTNGGCYNFVELKRLNKKIVVLESILFVREEIFEEEGEKENKEEEEPKKQVDIVGNYQWLERLALAVDNITDIESLKNWNLLSLREFTLQFGGVDGKLSKPLVLPALKELEVFCNDKTTFKSPNHVLIEDYINLKTVEKLVLRNCYVSKYISGLLFERKIQCRFYGCKFEVNDEKIGKLCVSYSDRTSFVDIANRDYEKSEVRAKPGPNCLIQ